MVRLAAVFALASAAQAARIQIDTAAVEKEAEVAAHASAEAIAEEESLEADVGQWTCPIGRRVRDPFGRNPNDPWATVCVMVLNQDGSRCTIIDDWGNTDTRHPMHLDEDDRCPQPTTTTTTTTTTRGRMGMGRMGMGRGWRTEPSLVIADGCPRSMGLQHAAMEPAITGMASVRCCSLDGASCETQTVGCLEGVSFFEANAACHSHGLRLCTRQELDGGVCCGTGCGYDGQQVWTVTPTLFPNPAVLRNAGSGRRIYAQSNHNGETGVGATAQGQALADQWWVIEDAGNGRYTIRNSDSGRLLFAQRNLDGGRGVGAWTGHEDPDQKWIIEPAEEDGTFTITNADSGRRLFARSDGNWENGFGGAVGDRVWADQTWYIDPVHQD